MPITTRSMTSARQEESKLDVTLRKLDLALKELEVSKGLVEQLHRERDDNETELLDSLKKYDVLKKHMAELHTEHRLVVDERDKLHSILVGFRECSDEYEQGLKRMSVLEQELQEAHRHITTLEAEKRDTMTSHSHSLFDELVGSAPSLVSTARISEPIVTIDLTSDDTLKALNLNTEVGIVQCSRNKFKKYVKINKYIAKTKKLIKRQKCMYKKVMYIKERRQLGDELDMYSLLLENNITEYDSDIKKMEIEICNLHKSLELMTNKYNSAKNECEEHMLALKCLIQSNCDQSDQNSSSSSPQSVCESLFTHHHHQSPSSNKNKNKNTNSSFTQNNIVKSETIMFSDELGKSMGQLLSMYLGQTVTNYCTPGLTYHDIIKKIMNYKFNENTTLLILVGHRGSMDKIGLLKCFDLLYSLNVKNVVLFTLPYSQSLPQTENNIRHKINLTLHTLTFNNKNTFHLIDINKYLDNKLYLTKDKFYLNKYLKRQIALSLSYYIEYSAKNLATLTAPIGQIIDIVNCTLESVPNQSVYNNLN